MTPSKSVTTALTIDRFTLLFNRRAIITPRPNGHIIKLSDVKPERSLLTKTLTLDWGLRSKLSPSTHAEYSNMKIGELAKQSGLSTHTLRFYEKSGLLKASGRSQSNYRIYTANDLETARFIKRARSIGFSMDEVATFLSIRSDLPAHVCADAKALADNKIGEIENQINELQNMVVALHRLSDACCGGNESAEYCTIIEALEQKELPEAATAAHASCRHNDTPVKDSH